MNIARYNNADLSHSDLPVNFMKCEFAKITLNYKEAEAFSLQEGKHMRFNGPHEI
jgi:hypothetical protein